MTMNGWMEATIVVPTAGWPIDFNDNVTGSYILTIPAGSYTYSHLGTAVAPALPGIVDTLKTLCAGTGNWSLVLNADGTVTFTNAETPGSITWDTDSADIQGILGFSANITASSGTSDLWPQGIWEPSCALQSYGGNEGTDLDDFHGWAEMDLRAQESAANDARILMGEYRYVRDFIFPACTAARTWKVNEATTGESYETFFRNVILAEKSWARPGGPICWNWNRNIASAKNMLYRVMAKSPMMPMQIAEQWTGHYRIEMPRCVLLPGFRDYEYFS